MEFAPLIVPPLSESETFKETHLQRMNRNFSGPEKYETNGYEKFKKGCRLAERGLAVGIGRDGSPGFDESRICSNTIKSHALVSWVAKNFGNSMSETLFDVLNNEHFLYGKNLNDTKFLISCCRKIGLDGVLVKNFLSSDTFQEERRGVIHIVNTLKEKGLDHIPLFIINQKYVIDGAPTAATFIMKFREIEEECMQQQVEAAVNSKVSAAKYLKVPRPTIVIEDSFANPLPPPIWSTVESSSPTPAGPPSVDNDSFDIPTWHEVASVRNSTAPASVTDECIIPRSV